jgi:hypothetical protein
MVTGPIPDGSGTDEKKPNSHLPEKASPDGRIVRQPGGNRYGTPPQNYAGNQIVFWM